MGRSYLKLVRPAKNLELMSGLLNSAFRKPLVQLDITDIVRCAAGAVLGSSKPKLGNQIAKIE